MSENVKIKIRNLYKIFGADPQSVLPHVHNGVGKEELLANHGHVLGLHDITLDMHEGKITVIMGLSGSGKSTLIRHINRLIEPTAGEILIDGEDALKLGVDALRQARRHDMSMVFQKFALLPHRTVVDNAALPLEVRSVDKTERLSEAARWLDRVGLGGFENHFPHQLSGGMQQRVGIARALTSNADIMLMDEAYSALDPLIRSDMQKLLLDLQVELGKTIVFITHDLDESLRLADTLVILKDGGIVQQGDPQGILLNPSDPYIEDFVSDINRARVLRVRSVMHEQTTETEIAGELNPDDNLESVIALSEGDSTKCYRVTQDGQTIGQLDMKAVLRALVPRMSSSERQSM